MEGKRWSKYVSKLFVNLYDAAVNRNLDEIVFLQKSYANQYYYIMLDNMVQVT